MEHRIQSIRLDAAASGLKACSVAGAILLGWALSSISTHAGAVFYTSRGDFESATPALALMGTEDWSSAGNAAATALTDPLAPGVAKAPFPSGTSAASGIQVQSNSLSNAPAMTSPGRGLFYAPAGFTGGSGNKQPSNQLSSGFDNDSFDILFSPVDGLSPTAARLSPMYYKIAGANSATVTIRVYNQANTLIGTTTVTNVKDCLEDAFIGIVATGSDRLGRVNLWATATDIAGADNIAVYGSATVGPRLRSVGTSAQGFSAWLDGDAGATYRILAATNAVQFVPIQTNTLASPSQLLTFPTHGPVRFYRAMQIP